MSSLEEKRLSPYRPAECSEREWAALIAQRPHGVEAKEWVDTVVGSKNPTHWYGWSEWAKVCRGDRPLASAVEAAEQVVEAEVLAAASRLVDNVIEELRAKVEAKIEQWKSELNENWEELHEGVLKGVGKVIASEQKHLDEVVAKTGILETERLRQRVEVLEKALGEERASGNVKFCGIYQRALSYGRGSMVTQAGALWAAIKDVSPGELPGESVDWQLAVKSGQVTK